jgi:hypothetical protein
VEDVLLDPTIRLGLEHPALDGLRGVLEPLHHVEVAVDDLVEQDVEEEPPAVPGHLGVQLPPLQDLSQIEGRRVSHGDQETRAGEGVDLVLHQVVGRSGEAVHHQVAVPLGVEGVDLGPLAPVPDVLDRQGVEPEALLQPGEVRSIGIDEVQPHHTPTLRQDLRDPVGVEVLLEATISVQRAGQHGAASVAHGRGRWSGARITSTDLARRVP